MSKLDRSFIKMFSYGGLNEWELEYLPTILRITSDERKKEFIQKQRKVIQHAERMCQRSLSLIHS